MSRPPVRPLLGLIALVFAASALVANGRGLGAALAETPWWAVVPALLAVLAGQACMLAAWRSALAGLGSPLPPPIAAKALFVGQLGRYVPGAVWSWAAMVELARDHGSPRTRTLGSIVIALAVTLAGALALSLTRLPAPFWGLLVLIAVGLHPRVLTYGLNLLLRLARRDPLPQVLPVSSLVKTVAWTALGWLCWGTHSWLLVTGISGEGLDFTLWPMAASAYALAWAAPILLPLTPAGLGVLEGAMVLTLTPSLGASRALAVTVVTRTCLVVADLVCAAAAQFAAARHRAQHVAS